MGRTTYSWGAAAAALVNEREERDEQDDADERDAHDEAGGAAVHGSALHDHAQDADDDKANGCRCRQNPEHDTHGQALGHGASLLFQL